MRVVRGWIYVEATRGDDGKLVLGGDDEMKFSPVDALHERPEIPMSAVWKASVQRLAFWRR